MPAYDYICDHCGHRHEIHVKMEWRDSLNLTCPDCGTKLHRGISAPMAELWGGKFEGRSLKKTNYDGTGSEW